MYVYIVVMYTLTRTLIVGVMQVTLNKAAIFDDVGVVIVRLGLVDIGDIGRFSIDISLDNVNLLI